MSFFFLLSLLWNFFAQNNHGLFSSYRQQSLRLQSQLFPTEIPIQDELHRNCVFLPRRRFWPCQDTNVQQQQIQSVRTHPCLSQTEEQRLLPKTLPLFSVPANDTSEQHEKQPLHDSQSILWSTEQDSFGQRKKKNVLFSSFFKLKQDKRNKEEIKQTLCERKREMRKHENSCQCNTFQHLSLLIRAPFTL